MKFRLEPYFIMNIEVNEFYYVKLWYLGVYEKNYYILIY